MKHLPTPSGLLVVALGAVPRALLVDVGAAVTTVYGTAVEPGPAQQPPVYAFNKDRNQYHATAIMRRLTQLTAGGSRQVLGVTDIDLFVPDAPFVFGEADRDAGTALVSLARLARGPEGKPVEPERLRRRIQVEAVHELGHLLGLSHCQDGRCAMFLSHKVSDSDRKGPGLCAACRAALGLT